MGLHILAATMNSGVVELSIMRINKADPNEIFAFSIFDKTLATDREESFTFFFFFLSRYCLASKLNDANGKTSGSRYPVMKKHFSQSRRGSFSLNYKQSRASDSVN